MLFRRISPAVAVLLLLGLAPGAAGAAPATHTDYTFETWDYFLDDPYAYVSHEADGWVFLSDMPLGGDYNASDIGLASLYLQMSGKVSADLSTGNFHGSMTLSAESGLTCSGRITVKRVDFMEDGLWVLHCDDGTKRHATFHIADFSTVPWLAVGEGTSLSPQG